MPTHSWAQVKRHSVLRNEVRSEWWQQLGSCLSCEGIVVISSHWAFFPGTSSLSLSLSLHWLRLCSSYLIRTGPDCVYWNFWTYKNEPAASLHFGSEHIFIWCTRWRFARGVIKVAHFVRILKDVLNRVMENSRIFKTQKSDSHSVAEGKHQNKCSRKKCFLMISILQILLQPRLLL